MNVEQRKKWYTAPALKEIMRTIQRKYNIGLSDICQELPHYKLIFKMDGVNLLEYLCEKHKIQISK
jgi:hypothetical protein